MTTSPPASAGGTTATTICLTLSPHAGSPSDTVLRLTRPNDTGSGSSSSGASSSSVVRLTRNDIVRAANTCYGGDDGGSTPTASTSPTPAFVRSVDGRDGVYVTARAPIRLPGGDGDGGGEHQTGPRSILPTSPTATKVPTHKLLTMTLPTIILTAMLYAWGVAPSCGLDAVFPSDQTTLLVLKLSVWVSLLLCVTYEHVWFWTTGPSRWLYGSGAMGGGEVEVEITVWGWSDGTSLVPRSYAGAVPVVLKSSTSSVAGRRGGGATMTTTTTKQQRGQQQQQRSMPPQKLESFGSSSDVAGAGSIWHVERPLRLIDAPNPRHVTTVSLPSPSTRAGIELMVIQIGTKGEGVRTVPAVKSVSADGEASKQGVKPGMVLLKFNDRETVKNRIRAGPFPVTLEFLDLDRGGDDAGAAGGGDGGLGKGEASTSSDDRADAVAAAAAAKSQTEEEDAAAAAEAPVVSSRASAPPAQELPPFRFIAAEKGDIESARRRYAVTLQWRADMGMDTIITEPHQNFAVIKKNWPHYYHLRGRNNEPCYYERPPDMNLKALRAAGLSIDDLLRHYALTCEFMWTLIEPSEDGKSIYVIDLNGMGMRDFAGEVVDFVKKTSAFTAAHYPERSGTIYLINVPSWFSIIWKTVKPWVDPVTQKKIRILGYGDEAITKALEERIPIENIPPEYGGKSMPLGQSPEEAMFREKMEKNNRLALETEGGDDSTVEMEEHEHAD